jgi:Alpha amylase, catalytic domain
MPTLRRLLILSLACVLSASLPALSQTLARPGWEGSGMSANLWWKHAVIYQANPRDFRTADLSALHGLAQRLDYLQSLGIDALLLTPIQPDATHAQTIDPTDGTLDDLDDLIHQASRHDIRVLLDLDPQIPTSDLSNVARFWLNRGIAGFHVIGSSDTAHAQAAVLHKACDSFLGQRILIGDADPSLPADPRQRTYKAPDPDSPQLLFDPRPGTQPKLLASAIRPAIDLTQDILQTGHSLPVLASDGPTYPRSMTRYADGQHDVAIAKALATILLASHADSLLYYGQELGVRSPSSSDSPNPTPLITWTAPLAPAKGKPAPTAAPDAPINAAIEDANPASLLNWYRQLIALHHGNSTIASGSNVTINQDDQNVLVWVRKPQTISPLTPPLVILCNLSAQPVHLSLKADIVRLRLRGSFLKTVLRSDHGMGTMHLDSMTIAPYTAYIGELRF